MNDILDSLGLELISVDGGITNVAAAECDAERLAVRAAALIFAYYGGKTIFMAGVLKSPIGTLNALEGALLSLAAVNVAHAAYTQCLDNQDP